MSWLTSMKNFVIGNMEATAANGYVQFQENDKDVIIPTRRGHPDEIDMSHMIDIHQDLRGDTDGFVQVDNSGGWWLK